MKVLREILIFVGCFLIGAILYYMGIQLMMLYEPLSAWFIFYLPIFSLLFAILIAVIRRIRNS